MDGMVLFILLTLLILTFVLFLKDKKDYAKFKTLSNTRQRQKIMKKWLVASFFFYGVLALVCLALLDKVQVLFELPPFLKGHLSAYMERFDTYPFVQSLLKGIFISLVPLLVIGMPLLSLLITYQSVNHPPKKTKKDQSANDVRNLNALLPRNAQERIYTGLLSVNAGIVEELFFRLLAPLLLFTLTNSLAVAIFGSTLWFALAHAYQGIAGVVLTFLMGLLLFFVYLYTASIWMAMLIHAIIDLNGLVLSPWFTAYLTAKKTKV